MKLDGTINFMLSKGKIMVGVDIEDIDRFRKFDYDYSDSFLSRIFTKQELEYCFSKSELAPHLAVRYAAKEAIVKALSGIVDEDIDYKNISIERNKKGAPEPKIKGYENLDIKLSLSHTKDTAIAFCIIKINA